MKARHFLFLTHGLTAAAAAAGAYIATHAGSSIAATCGAALVVLLTVVIQGWLLGFLLKQNLQDIVHAVASAGGLKTRQIKIKELEAAGNKLCEYALRWSEATSASRRQARELDELTALLDRRTPRVEHPASAGGAALRPILGGIANAADAGLGQMVTCLDDIAQCMDDVARQADDQFNALTKTATCVEQISASIDTAHNDADEAHNSAELFLYTCLYCFHNIPGDPHR